MDGVVHGQDEWEDGVFDLDFCWIPMSQLEKLHVIPEELVDVLLKNKDNIVHFVSRQD